MILNEDLYMEEKMLNEMQSRMLSGKTLILIFVLLVTTCLYSTIINVPDDQPTIQEGIDVAVDADTVLVQSGTYVENINYNGKLIIVASLFLTTQDTTYISQTVIDGDSLDSVVKFESGEDSTAVLFGFTITNGEAEVGGGIYCLYSSPSLVNVIITSNSANDGGGIWCSNNSSPNLQNVTITGNSSIGIFSDGGGIFCYNSSPNIENVTISGNSAEWGGGGISCVTNSNPSLVNVTISGNSAGAGGGIYCAINSNPSLINCIMWNNSPQEVCFHDNNNPNSIIITYSDIQGGEAGIVTNNNGTVNWLEGNIDEDPLFVGTGDHPFMLQDLSLCVNAGIPDTTGLNLPEFDLAGNPRVYGGRIDMGAYENQNIVVSTDDNLIPLITKLNQNYPNPFNPSGAGRSPTTTFSFSIPNKSKVTLSIYNIKGQKVKTLVNEEKERGIWKEVWNGKDDKNKIVSSGVYLYKLDVAGKTKAVKKCLMLK